MTPRASTSGTGNGSVSSSCWYVIPVERGPVGVTWSAIVFVVPFRCRLAILTAGYLRLTLASSARAATRSLRRCSTVEPCSTPSTSILIHQLLGRYGHALDRRRLGRVHRTVRSGRDDRLPRRHRPHPARGSRRDRRAGSATATTNIRPRITSRTSSSTTKADRTGRVDVHSKFIAPFTRDAHTPEAVVRRRLPRRGRRHRGRLEVRPQAVHPPVAAGGRRRRDRAASTAARTDGHSARTGSAPSHSSAADAHHRVEGPQPDGVGSYSSTMWPCVGQRVDEAGNRARSPCGRSSPTRVPGSAEPRPSHPRRPRRTPGGAGRNPPAGTCRAPGSGRRRGPRPTRPSPSPTGRTRRCGRRCRDGRGSPRRPARCAGARRTARHRSRAAHDRAADSSVGDGVGDLHGWTEPHDR